MDNLTGGIGRAFASRNYRIYWLAHLATILGVWVNRIAIQWVTWELTESFAWLGIIGAANMVPTLIFGPIAGATADRYGHRIQLQISTMAGGLVALAMAILVMTGLITIELLLVLALLAGTSRAFNVGARGALVHAVVPKGLLSAAIGVSSATFHGGNFFGVVLGGTIIATLGAGVALVVYAVGAAIAVFLLSLLRIDESQWKNAEPRKFELIADLRAGFAYTFGHRGIRLIMSMSAMVALFVLPYLEMLAGVADEVFARRADGLAVLASATGLGAMIGGLWLARRGRTEGLTRILLGASALGALGVAAFALTEVFWLALLPMFLIGIAVVSAQIASMSLIQNAVAQEFRARVFSINAVISVGFPALGAIGIGWVANLTGVQIPLLGASLIGLVAWAILSKQVLEIAAEVENQGPSTAGTATARGA